MDTVAGLSALLAAVRGGLSLTALPWYVAHDSVRDSVLQPLLQQWTLPAQEIHAVFNSPRLVPTKVVGFVDYLLPRFEGDWRAGGAAPNPPNEEPTCPR